MSALYVTYDANNTVTGYFMHQTTEDGYQQVNIPNTLVVPTGSPVEIGQQVDLVNQVVMPWTETEVTAKEDAATAEATKIAADKTFLDGVATKVAAGTSLTQAEHDQMLVMLLLRG